MKEFTTRAAWQADRLTANFPDGGEPFLPPQIEDEEKLFELYQESPSRSFDSFAQQHSATIRQVDDFAS